MPARFRIDTSILVRLATGDPEDGFERCVCKLSALIELDVGGAQNARIAATSSYRLDP